MLSCLLINPPCLPEVAETIGTDEDCFYDLKHQLIYHAIQQLIESGKALDLITLHQHLKNTEMLDDIGGVEYLGALADAAPSAANLPSYLAIVREKHLLRKTVTVCTDALRQIYEHPDDADKLMNSIERDILAVRKTKDIWKKERSNLTSVRKLIAHYDDAAMRKLPLGLTTGFVDLDKLLPSLLPQNYFVIGANTSVGKTSLLLNIIDKVLTVDLKPVVLFSMEMSREEVLHRMACTRAEVDGVDMLQGRATSESMLSVASALVQVGNDMLVIDDEPALTITRMQAKLRRIIQDTPGVAMVGVDYLQLMSSGKNTSSMTEDLTLVSNGIKQLAKEFDVPFVVLSQLSRDNAKTNRRPAMHDLRQCGSIEQDADKIALLHLEQAKPGQLPVVEVILAKNRGGRTDSCKLQFVPKHTKFRSLDEDCE